MANELLNWEDIRPAIERVLLHLHYLLQQADLVTERFESHSDKVGTRNLSDDQLDSQPGSISSENRSNRSKLAFEEARTISQYGW